MGEAEGTDAVSFLQLAVNPKTLPRGPIAADATETLRRLTGWGVTVAADAAFLVLEGPEGVIYGIRDQGHLLAPIVTHRADLYRLASMTSGAASALPT